MYDLKAKGFLIKCLHPVEVADSKDDLRDTLDGRFSRADLSNTTWRARTFSLSDPNGMEVMLFSRP